MDKIDLKDDGANKYWNLYMEKRNLDLKKEANKILEMLVEYIEDRNESEKYEIVKNICFAKFERKVEIELQYPILSRIIFPTLIEYIDKPKMPELRWLYQIEFHSDNSYEKLCKKLNCIMIGILFKSKTTK